MKISIKQIDPTGKILKQESFDSQILNIDRDDYKRYYLEIGDQVYKVFGNTKLVSVLPNPIEEKDTKTYTIRKININGKWVEYWFEEEKLIKHVVYDDVNENIDQWIESTKQYMLYEEVNKANLENHILNHGYVGLKTDWKKDGINWNLIKIYK